MPSCPIAMPSSIAIVLNSAAKHPNFSISFFIRLPYFMQMYMAGNELGERIDDCDDGVSHLRFFHAVGSP